MMKRLKLATRERHAALESQLPLMNPALSRECYQQFLSRFYGYYAPLETLLLALPWWNDIGFDYTDRVKTPNLQRDLLTLGDTPDTMAEIPSCQQLPELESIQQLLGCLYVIEGSTLGGQIIIRHLQTTLGLSPETGAAFFNGYGNETGARWQAFGALLTHFSERMGDEELIFSAANQTFATLEQWLFPQSHPLSAQT